MEFRRGVLLQDGSWEAWYDFDWEEFAEDNEETLKEIAQRSTREEKCTDYV